MNNYDEIQMKLRAAREAVSSDRGLKGTGFWSAVSKVRRDRDLAERFGKQIGEIDHIAFENSVKLRVSETAGRGLLIAGVLGGILIAAASNLFDGLLGDLAFLAGFGAVLVFTHSLAHWLVGRAMGMRFTHYFIGGPPPPRPGIKVDYESYLKVDPSKRAMFHASGAVVTKLLPFLSVPAALGGSRSDWVVWILLGLGILQILTDVFFSTKTSDWKKYIRETRAARRAKGWG